MADPISVRNNIVQSSMVEKIQQVQQQQEALHHRYMANPKADEVERKKREVQTSQESAEAKIRDKRGDGENGKREGGEAAEKILAENVEDSEVKGNDPDAESGPGRIIDIKV